MAGKEQLHSLAAALGKVYLLPRRVGSYGDLYRISYIKGPQKRKICRFFNIFSALFPNIWPLAGPNIAKKGEPLQKLARVDRQTHFGTFNFWIKPGFPI